MKNQTGDYYIIYINIRYEKTNRWLNRQHFTWAWLETPPCTYSTTHLRAGLGIILISGISIFFYVRNVSWVMSKFPCPVQRQTMENNGLEDKMKRLNHYRYNHHFYYIQYQPIRRQLNSKCWATAVFLIWWNTLKTFVFL